MPTVDKNSDLGPLRDSSYMHSGKDQQPPEPRYPWTVVLMAIVLLGLILLILHFVEG